MTAGISLLARKPQHWEVLPGPAHVSKVPLPAPSVPVATGTSILQLTEPLAWCLSFSIWGGFLLLCSVLPALPLLGLSPVVKAMCLGQKQRRWAPGPLEAALRVPAEPRWDEPSAPLCGHVLSEVGPCPTAGRAIRLLSSWGKAKRNPRPGSQGTLARSEGVCGSESDPTQPLSCYSLGKDGFGPCRPLAPRPHCGVLMGG